MKCDKCKKNEANFHRVSNINGKVSEIHLCSECAKQTKEFDFDKEFASLNFGAKSFFDDIMTDFKTSFSYFTNPLLDSFLNFEDFDEDFFLNRVSAKQLNSEKQNKKDDSNNEQKVKLTNEEKQKLEIQKLDLELKKAVVEERYEDAIKLRDKLKELRNKK